MLQLIRLDARPSAKPPVIKQERHQRYIFAPSPGCAAVLLYQPQEAPAWRSSSMTLS